jgi:hypothetical protein
MRFQKLLESLPTRLAHAVPIGRVSGVEVVILNLIGIATDINSVKDPFIALFGPNRVNGHQPPTVTCALASAVPQPLTLGPSAAS